ncbi:hypothetical protein CZ787_15870 [Halomonas citrativorans]|uniref:Uncharacterized protein n=1 Tax=Halomonas citrativorans TaxID=2742612 RepID=A0A1R4I5I6_9GAMM|nr:hypothetical protein CZ787_15870 [Halomonas citrativorans]
MDVLLKCIIFSNLILFFGFYFLMYKYRQVAKKDRKDHFVGRV